jgi:uncharacterized membrane protein
MSSPFLTSKQLALVAVFAALQAVLSTLPYTISIGVSGQITLGVIGVPIIGILLGPYLGGLAVLIGSFIGIFTNPGGALFGFFSVLPPTLGAIGAGFCMQRKSYVPGAIILVSILVFYAHPYGREAFLYPWLHIIAMVAAFLFSVITARWSSMFSDAKKIGAVIPLLVFIGTLTDHISGSALAIWYFDPILTPDIWNVVMFVYPLERIAVVVLASLITVPLYFALQKAGLLSISGIKTP